MNARVALVLDRAGRAGTERHVESLCRALPARGVSLALFVSGDGPLVATARAAGVVVFDCPRSSPTYVLRLARALRAWAPDLVHAHSGRLACIAARLAGVEAIVETRHGIHFDRDSPGAGRRARGEGLRSRLAHRTVAVCQSDADWLVRSGGLPAKRIEVIPNGIVVEELSAEARAERRRQARHGWGIESGAPVVGFVGRLVEQKAPERFIELIAGLGTLEPRVRGVIVGAGAAKHSLSELARRLDVASLLTWLEEADDARALYPGMDLLALPSRWEGLPYVLLEAMAEGVPVLATPVGGIPEVLIGSTLGASLLPWDLRAWVQASHAWLGDATSPAALAAWQAAARVRLEAFSERAMIERILEVYERMLRPA